MNVASTQPPRSPLVLRQAVLASFGPGVCFALAWSACAALESGVYQTLPGATVEERGDRVTNGIRVVPITATFTFDFSATPPALTAVMPNAVLEGGAPFALTVRSSFGAQLTDGTYYFRGDYLEDLYPSGTQYGFDWRFSTSPNGATVWNGNIGWAGGHIWMVTISNLTIAPQAWLSISHSGNESVQLTWATNFADYVLEHLIGVFAAGWDEVTNTVSTTGGCFSVTIAASETNRYYRLRKL